MLSFNSCVLDGTVAICFQYSDLSLLRYRSNKLETTKKADIVSIKKREESKLKMHAVEIHYINIL